MRTPSHLPSEPADLLRRAAEVGPGRRGRRRDAGPEERRALASALAAKDLDVPPYVLEETDWVARPAKLFEAGDYPDKAATVSEADLDALCDAFDLPVPVLIEHAASPLMPGYLVDVERQGTGLFGTVALSREADAFVRKCGAKALSLGLAPDLRAIEEVSLVRHPRVESARLFSGELVEREPDPVPVSPARIEDWVRRGKLTPAQAPFAQAILSAPARVAFDGESRPVAALLAAMLDRQPPHALFHETVPASHTEAAAHLMLPEEAEFYRRHFPGIDLGDIARNR